MLLNTFEKRLGKDLFRQYVSGRLIYNAHNALRRMIKRGHSAWFDDPDSPRIETLGDVLEKSLIDALGHLEERLGSDMTRWRWGSLLTLRFVHPFGRASRLLGAFLDIGPMQAGGSISTVNPSHYMLMDPWKVVAGTSQRSIFDLSARRDSLHVLPTGTSGNFMSPHYDDQTRLWHRGEYRPFVLDRQRVETERVTLTRLLPE
jgi:penicillin amidase